MRIWTDAPNTVVPFSRTTMISYVHSGGKQPLPIKRQEWVESGH